MANGKKTGGRQKGTPNKANVAKAAEIAASGLTPLDYMLAVMRDDGMDVARRDEMAKAAAPYCHNRLASVELSGETVTRFVAEIPAQSATTDTWQQQHVPPQLIQ